MSDDAVRTRVDSDEGWLDFQEYFVGRQCRPMVRALEFVGADTARAQPDFLAALASPRLRGLAVFIGSCRSRSNGF